MFHWKSHTIEKQRGLLGSAIQDLYLKVAAETEPVLEDRHIMKLPIRIATLEMAGQEEERSELQELSFFEPMSEEAYDRYGIVENQDAKIRLKGLKRVLDNPRSDMSPLNDGSFLCNSLVWVMNGAQRAGVPKDERGLGTTLGFFLGWLHQDFYFEYGIDQSFSNTVLNNPETKPRAEHWGYWRRFPNADKPHKPHFMFILGIDCEGEEGLLRVEVLTILAAMKNRLAHSLLTDHIVFPIMVFSFMGRQARIIQAYHDGQELVIRKSQLFTFQDSTTNPMNLLARYVANRPVGETQQFPPRILGQSIKSTVRSTSKTDARRPHATNHSNGLRAQQSSRTLRPSKGGSLRRTWSRLVSRKKKHRAHVRNAFAQPPPWKQLD